MNASYLALILWIGSMIVQFIAYMVLAARQRGRDEAKIAEINLQNDAISRLKEDAIEHRLMTENIATYLEAKNGISFRRY
jgi:hypothetical protein